MKPVNRSNMITMLAASVLGSSFLLGGCGSSNSSDDSPAEVSDFGSGSDRIQLPVKNVRAAITDVNKEELVELAVRGVKKIIQDDQSQKKVPFAQSATGLSLSDFCSSGTANLQASADQIITDQVLTADMCVIDDFAIDGNALLTSANDYQTLTFYFFDMTVTDPEGVLHSLAGTEVSCADIESLNPSCTLESYWTDNGENYRVVGEVSGSDSAGYDARVTVYDNINGYISVTTDSQIRLECEDSSPSSGAIQLIAENATATVTFDSCGSGTLVLNGVATTISWSDL